MTHILAWICLVLVTCTAAYGLQLTSAAMVPSAAAAEPRQVTSTSVARRVVIVVLDPVTGDKRAQVECEAPASGFASYLVELVEVGGDSWDLSSVARLCADPTVIGPLASY